MELYTLNPVNNRREEIIESYDSFIWTERYNAYGDLTIEAEPQPRLISRIKPGTWIGFDESNRVMEVKSSKVWEDDEGAKHFTIKGSSLERILEDRAAKLVLVPDPWYIKATPGKVLAHMVHTVCVIGIGPWPDDIIPNMIVTDRTNTTNTYSVTINGGNLYAKVKEISDSFDIGFRMTVIPNNPTLNFDFYRGRLRTGENGVRFSEELENLSNPAHLRSTEGFKNVAYVYGRNGSYQTVGPAVWGWDRRVLLVDATDIDLPLAGGELDAALIQRGREALAEHKAEEYYDGVVNPIGPYKYNRDYFLGDIVELAGKYGIATTYQPMRVMEHIWAHDSQGFRSYPTLGMIG